MFLSFLLSLVSAPVQAQRSHLWVGVLMGLLLATVVALALSFLARRRGKETPFGYGAHHFAQPARQRRHQEV